MPELPPVTTAVLSVQSIVIVGFSCAVRLGRAMAPRTHADPVASPSETIPSIPLGYTAGCGFISTLTPLSRQAPSSDQLSGDVPRHDRRSVGSPAGGREGSLEAKRRGRDPGSPALERSGRPFTSR